MTLSAQDKTVLVERRSLLCSQLLSGLHEDCYDLFTWVKEWM